MLLGSVVKPAVVLPLGVLLMVALFLVSALTPPIVLIIALSLVLLAAFLYLGLRSGPEQ
ncbi:MAG TPA: hypothetical protein VFB58_15415 [Chloroflexota bacterium]|nr:hypothetical protein [Chloroflexota bacterium]